MSKQPILLASWTALLCAAAVEEKEEEICLSLEAIIYYYRLIMKDLASLDAGLLAHGSNLGGSGICRYAMYVVVIG